jgi:hypothetical protein
MTQHGIILFHTNSAVMRAEKVLGRAGLTVKLIPIPRQFSSDCGVALQFDWEEREAAEEELARAKVETVQVTLMPS